MGDIAEIDWSEVLLGDDVDFNLSAKARLILRCRVELFGALERLKRAENELQFFELITGRIYHKNLGNDEHERELLEVELDESKRQVERARQELQSAWAQGA